MKKAQEIWGFNPQCRHALRGHSRCARRWSGCASIRCPDYGPAPKGRTQPEPPPPKK